MRNFILGIIIGASVMGTLAIAQTSFYDSKGQPNAPHGSVQQFDYFRQRQAFIDLGNIAADNRRAAAANPCGR